LLRVKKKFDLPRNQKHFIFWERERKNQNNLYFESERVPISQYIWTFGVEISLGVMAVELAKQAPLLKTIVHTHT
jgi:hypothetical protein